ELRRVDLAHRDAEMAEGLDDLIRLVGAHQTVVHQDRMDALPQSLPEEQRRHRGIDAARNRANDRSARCLPSVLPDLLLPESGHRPVRSESADPKQEVLENGRAVLRMPDLRMKLDRVETALRVFEAGDRVGARGSDDACARWRLPNRVSVVHPDRLLRL